MANRFVLNETSYHGAGAIKDIATEAKGRGFKKKHSHALTPDLIKFGVTKKVIDVLEELVLIEIHQILSQTQQSRMYRLVLKHSRSLVLIT